MFKAGHMKRARYRALSRRDVGMLLIGCLIALASVELVTFIKDHRSAVPYQAVGINSPWIPSTVRHWQQPINEMAKKYNIDSNLVAIVMTMESGGYAKAKSSANAQGLMQVTPPTAKDIASKHLKKPVKSYNLQDSRTNIEFGTAYLAYLRKTFETPNQGPSWNNTVELIAASYNGGPLAGLHLEQGKGLHDAQTVIYSRDAFNMWRERHAKNSPTFDRWKERGGSTLIDKAKKAVDH
jgi:soluble lytic murein transglycosylase-like protein